MLLNLSRSFHFDREHKEYHIDYMFTKEVLEGGTDNDICLVLEVAIGYSKRKTYKVAKPLSTLYLSNQDIEKMIEEETTTYFHK
ncbi:MAG TPA: hypothetical protein VGC29_08685 [Flavisolibacter sp.]